MLSSLKNALAVSCAVVLMTSCGSVGTEDEAAPITANPASDSVENGEWLTWGGDHGFRRYSPLSEINAENADQVGVVWRWNAPPLETRPDINMKSTPIFVDGLLYTPAGVNQVYALNPATGETIWEFNPDPQVIKGRHETISSRGVAYWTDGTEKRLFHNTRDGRLLSIDAITGEADTSFGENGQILLRENLRPDGEDAPFVGSSSPPAIVGDVVIAQVVADITAPNKEATPGHIRGFDVRTGELLWTFHTIPQEGEFGNDTWAGDSWKYTGNNGVWSMMSVDVERGYVYLPVEAPSHDFYGGHREGDNLFSQSIVCLDGKTGERVWHFQLVHHGLWDYDPPAAPILHDIVMDGETIPAVTQITKQGMSFVFNRVTGEPVWPIEERPVPQSPVPGEVSSPTQPFPTKPEYYVKLGYSEDGLIDFTPELREKALEIASNYVRGPMYTPPTPIEENGTKGTWVQPGYGGGGNWNGAAFDPETGLMFVPNRHTAFVASLGTPDPALTNWDYLRMPTGSVPSVDGLPITKPPYSTVTATDMSIGNHVWERSIGGAPDEIRNHPALQGLDLDFDNFGFPGVRPSPLVTSTLLFLAESGQLSGDPGGPLFRAYDKTTGETLAEIELPGLSTSAPMTYLHDGRQYIVIAVGSAEHPAELVALSLPEPDDGDVIVTTATNSAKSVQTETVSDIDISADEIKTAWTVYEENCGFCHGPAGEGVSPVAPGIKGLTDYTSVRERIEQGGVEMPAMATMLSDEELDLITRFVITDLPEN
ncbi:MAG: pyrroloquinoline quinone-dependent dehydrogenase [Ponticaulis sp.]|nr:pyrroloquinoline quinone-dependent dehydrogenase [Ponticaulis sp.]|tara:strand:+ start:6779 stop:9079 length:2301 start_codon:yes stop_codon:yes gene_type:complete